MKAGKEFRSIPDLEELIRIAGMCRGVCLEESDYAQDCSAKRVKLKVLGREDYYINFSDITSPRP